MTSEQTEEVGMIDKLIEAARLALDALTCEDGEPHHCQYCDEDIDGSGDVRARLRAAIEAVEKAAPVEICVIGLHASRRPWRALQYAPTPEMLATTSQPLSAQARAATQCRCTLVQQSVGDGCEVCNPKLAQRLACASSASVPEEPR